MKFTKLFSSIEELAAANKAAGYHFFHPDYIETFGTEVHGGLVFGRYFVTSELGYERRYTVRIAHKDGYVGTVGEFMGHGSLDAAQHAAQMAWVDELERMTT